MQISLHQDPPNVLKTDERIGTRDRAFFEMPSHLPDHAIELAELFPCQMGQFTESPDDHVCLRCLAAPRGLAAEGDGGGGRIACDRNAMKEGAGFFEDERALASSAEDGTTKPQSHRVRSQGSEECLIVGGECGPRAADRAL